MPEPAGAGSSRMVTVAPECSPTPLNSKAPLTVCSKCAGLTVGSNLYDCGKSATVRLDGKCKFAVCHFNHTFGAKMPQIARSSGNLRGINQLP